mgnify:CR=1 FL=1
MGFYRDVLTETEQTLGGLGVTWGQFGSSIETTGTARRLNFKQVALVGAFVGDLACASHFESLLSTGVRLAFRNLISVLCSGRGLGVERGLGAGLVRSGENWSNSRCLLTLDVGLFTVRANHHHHIATILQRG